MKTNQRCLHRVPALRKAQGRKVSVSSVKSLRAPNDSSPELQQKLPSETITGAKLMGLLNKSVEDTEWNVPQGGLDRYGTWSNEDQHR